MQIGDNVKLMHTNDLRSNVNISLENQGESDQDERQPFSQALSSDNIVSNPNILSNPILVAPDRTPENKDTQQDQRKGPNGNPEKEMGEISTRGMEEQEKDSTTLSPTSPQAYKTTRSGRIVKPPVKLNL